MVAQRAAVFLLGFRVLTAGVGCSDGPPLGTVSGKVTQGGQPIPFAYVQFQPTDPPGTYASAYTDVEGQYELRFSESRNGALVGRHEVTIRTAALDEIQVEDRETGKLVTPALPAGYQPKLELKYERAVEAGANTHDFQLETGTPQ
ncbi:MAG: carboxypeptidase-like regulatory domain-containing protein [Planctomycetota bacterium]